MGLLKVIKKFFQRIMNSRHDRFPLTEEAKIANLRLAVQRISEKK